MRLLQVNLRGLLIYSLALVLVSIPVSLFFIRAIINREVDESIAAQSDQFIDHIKKFEVLDDLETDLMVFDQLSYNIHIKSASSGSADRTFTTVMLYDSIDRDMEPFRRMETIVSVKGRPYLLTVQMSLINNDDLIEAIAFVQIMLSILLATGLLLINKWLSRRLWKPFYKTLDQLKSFELDNEEPVLVDQSRIAEFNDLNLAVLSLVERSRRSFVQQKEFIENAAHELQTPIAIFQAKLDSLMQSASLSQLDADTILELESTAQRMSKLNKNLLLLSKIDNEQFIAMEECDVKTIIEHQLRSLSPMAAMNGIHVDTLLEPLCVQANRALIEVLTSNLLHNAIRYSPWNENLHVSINNSVLSVSNKGPQIQLTLDQMTERFRKESTHPSSTGLGLAIVKKICETYGYKLGYRFDHGAHIFTVAFENRNC